MYSIFRKILQDIAAVVFSPHDPSNIESWSNVFMVQEGFRRLEEYNKLLGVYKMSITCPILTFKHQMQINNQKSHETSDMFMQYFAKNDNIHMKNVYFTLQYFFQ